jgi:hypothetical protein
MVLLGKRGISGAIFVVLFVSLLSCATTFAARYTSPSFIIDPNGIGNSVGGPQASTSYKLTSAGGESIIGSASGGSYKLTQGYVSQLNKSIQINLQPNYQVAYYPFDEATTARVYDNSIYTNDVATTGTFSTTSGKVGSALTFDGSTNYIDTGNPSQFQIVAGTLEAWIKTSSTTGTHVIAQKENNYYMTLVGNKLSTYNATTTTTCSESTSGIADGQWHHVAMVFQSGPSQAYLYKDGALVATCTMHTVDNTGNLYIGDNASHNQKFNGQIDEVKVFNNTLTAQDIKAEYDAGVAGVTGGLSLRTVTPGTSKTVSADINVLTDSAGYNLSFAQNQNLTSGAYSIPAISGSIASPLTWVEGTTKGLGFTLTSTNATAIPGKWSSGNAYAAFPGSATSFYDRAGLNGGTKDKLSIRLRLDVATSQAAADYTNQVTLTGTMTP